MLIPIGQENSIVRRHPLVSYAVIALNVAVFVAMSLAGTDEAASRDVAERWRDVSRYLSEHPYLEPPARLSRFLGERLQAELRQEREEYAARAAYPDPETLRREQARFEVLVDQLMAARRVLPMNRRGYIPAHPAMDGLLTSMFVHAGLLHLLGNMLFFYVSGPFVEDVFGRPLFAVFYLLAGVAATLAHAFKFPDSELALVGASGAIAGVMGAFLIRLGRSRIRFLFMPILLLPRLRFTFLLPAFVVLPLWLLEQFFYASQASREAGVAWWAHIGGFGFGVVVAALVKVTRVEERFIHSAIEKRIGIVQHPALEAAFDARNRGAWARARAEIRKVLAAEPDNVDAWREGYEIAVGSGEPAEAARLAVRLLERYLADGETALAVGLIHDAHERARDALPAVFYVAATALLESEGDARSAVDLYQHVADRWPSEPAAFRALFRQGEILRKSGDLGAARRSYVRASSHAACPDSFRAAAEGALARMDASGTSERKREMR